MNQNRLARFVPVIPARHRRLSFAALIALAACSPAIGQTIPHQAAQRGAIGTGLGQAELPKGTVFEPRIEAALQYAANINLVEDGQPQIDMAGLELAPGLYASVSSGTVLAAIDYSLIGRAWEESDNNDVSHSLAANGEWLAVPEWFRVRGQASYSDAVIDPQDGLNYGGIGVFGPSNLTEIATASITPVVQHRFNYLEFSAQYSYGRTWYLDEGKGEPVVGFVSNQDSTDQAANVSAGTGETWSRAYATAFYDWQKSEYDAALPYRFERVGLDAGYQVSRTLTLVGDVGKESDLDASTTQGGLDSDFWSAGLRWDPNDRTSAEGRYGERFFGSSWSLAIRHRARILEFDASYSEQPTVETRTLSLGDFDPGSLPPGFEGEFVGRINSSPYVARNARAGIRAEGSRTTMGLAAYFLERDYIRTLRQDETTVGASFDVIRQLASNFSTDFSVSVNEYEQSAGSLDPDITTTSTFRDLQTLLRLNRTSGERLTLSGEAGWFMRTNDVDYDGWWVAVRARWTP